MLRSMTRFTLILIACAAFGCNQQAQSQQQADAEPTALEAEPVEANPTAPEIDTVAVNNLSDEIYESRRNAITRAVESSSPAVVSVNVMEVRRVRYADPFSDPWMEHFFGRRRSRIYEQQVQSVGSGFVISPDGYIVTNEHVAGHAAKITVAFTDGKTLEAQLVGGDEVTDLALLKVEPEGNLPYLNFADTGQPITGEWAIALGNPFGLFEASEPSVTVGVVSGIGRDFQPQENRIYRDMIQTDAAINQGNSGGPLINALGEVIGVNTFIYTSAQGGGSIGLGFAVPASKVKQIVKELRESGVVDRSYYTGLWGLDVNSRIARALNMEKVRGFIVRDVDAGSPADEAGFRPYDVIVSFEDEDIDDQLDLAARLFDYRPGDVIKLGVLRDGLLTQVNMRLGRQQDR